MKRKKPSRIPYYVVAVVFTLILVPTVSANPSVPMILFFLSVVTFNFLIMPGLAEWLRDVVSGNNWPGGPFL